MEGSPVQLRDKNQIAQQDALGHKEPARKKKDSHGLGRVQRPFTYAAGEIRISC